MDPSVRMHASAHETPVADASDSGIVGGGLSPRAGSTGCGQGNRIFNHRARRGGDRRCSSLGRAILAASAAVRSPSHTRSNSRL